MNTALKQIKSLLSPLKPKPFSWQDFYLQNVYIQGEEDARALYEKVRNETMIGPAGVIANIDAIDYLTANKIPGAIVECGVWRGGSVMAMLLRLLQHKDASRECFLFDTYAGMTEPTEFDVKRGQNALQKFNDSQTDTHNEWCYASLEHVQHNIQSTGYPADQVHFIKGDILKTLPEALIPDIALLRLDTDWYESTKLELELLYPKVVKGGVIIIDDYGAWDGARKAADEYFAAHNIHPLMGRVDQTRRIFTKI